MARQEVAVNQFVLIKQEKCMNIKFTLHKRVNTFKKGGTEWALNAHCQSFNGRFTIKTYATKPSQSKLEGDIDVINRSMETYHVLYVRQLSASFAFSRDIEIIDGVLNA